MAASSKHYPWRPDTIQVFWNSIRHTKYPLMSVADSAQYVAAAIYTGDHAIKVVSSCELPTDLMVWFFHVAVWQSGLFSNRSVLCSMVYLFVTTDFSIFVTGTWCRQVCCSAPNLPGLYVSALRCDSALGYMHNPIVIGVLHIHNGCHWNWLHMVI